MKKLLLFLLLIPFISGCYVSNKVVGKYVVYDLATTYKLANLRKDTLIFKFNRKVILKNVDTTFVVGKWYYVNSADSHKSNYILHTDYDAIIPFQVMCIDHQLGLAFSHSLYKKLYINERGVLQPMSASNLKIF